MLFTFLPTAAFAASTTFTKDGIQYTVTDEAAKTVSVTKYTGTDLTVDIPKNVEYNDTTYTVTKILARTFLNATITKVQIPSTVNYIGSSAFSGCTSLTSVTFGEPSALQEIRNNAFYGCSISTIRIPASVNCIGFQAFDSSLKEILYDGTKWSSSNKYYNYGYTFASLVKYRRTITFTTNTPGQIDNQYVYDSYPVTKPTDPEQAGFEFVGWYTKDSPKEYDFSTPVTGNLDLYAKWQPSYCNVTFDLNGHPNAKNPPASHLVKHSQPVTEPSPAPEEPGYTFGGWYKKQTCPNDSKFDFTTPITDHITLYAKWEINKYTVTFDFNTGKPSTPKTEEVEYDNPVSEPAKPTNTGYTFGGWYTDQACTAGKEFTFGADGKSTTPITDHITLYAKWEINKYTVTFDVDGQTNLIPPASVEHGNGVLKPTDPTKEGYTFDGWYTDATCTNKYTLWGDSITKNTTFYARWNVNQYELAIHYTDTDSTSKPYDYGTTIKLDIPQRDGYTFDGWIVQTEDDKIEAPTLNLNQNLQYEFTMPASNVTLTAKWLKDAYTVTFNGMEHELDIVRINVKRNTPVDKPADPVDDGYTFHGWYTDKDCTTAFDFDTPITADTTLYAKWTKNAEPVKPSEPDKPSTPDKPGTPDTPSKPDNPSNPDKPNKPDNPSEPDKPSNPDKPSKPETYSVFVFDGEAELDGETVTTAEAGKTITVRLMADIVPAGQTFDHWEVLPETLELKDAQSTETTFVMPEEAVTLRAVYRDIPSAPQSVDPASAALGAAVLGTGVVIAGWTAYNIGLELYAKWVLPAGAEMPNTRGELAVLLWQAAGSPEPATLTEGMSELEKAERWVVENGLMAESKNSSFAPEEKVSKLEVFLTLKKAKALTQ